MNTNHGHPDPCHKSPLAITRTPNAIGGKVGMADKQQSE